MVLTLISSKLHHQGTAPQFGFHFLLQDSDSIPAVSLAEVCPPFLQWIQQEAGNPEQDENLHLQRDRETPGGAG